MGNELQRCWNTDNPLYVKYHDEEWGVPLHEDNKLFEFFVLDAFQAGLSWLIILKKRDAFRKAFDNFDPEKIAKYTDEDVERLVNDSDHCKKQIQDFGNNQQRMLHAESSKRIR